METTIAIAGRPGRAQGRPARRTGQAAAIDLAHLSRYTLGDRALEAEILALFLGQAPQTIGRLAEARTEKAWREAAHTLKGSARAVGATDLAAAAEACERIAGWADTLAGQAGLDDVAIAYEAAEAFIRARAAAA